MPLTKDFKDTIRSRVQEDPEFRRELFLESVNCLLGGDLETAKGMLRDFVNATIGFERLGELTGKPPKSLMRMLGPKGNPQARNLLDLIVHLQRVEEIELRVEPEPPVAASA